SWAPSSIPSCAWWARVDRFSFERGACLPRRALRVREPGVQGGDKMNRLIIVEAALCLAMLGGCTRADKAEVNRQAHGLGANVDAKGTVVTLKGDVNTREQADQAEQVARGTTGVTSVVNHLMLRVPAKSSGPSDRSKSTTGT